MIPVYDTVIPVYDTVLPVYNTVIPVYDTVLPVYNTVIPVYNTVLPVYNTALPVYNTVMQGTSAYKSTIGAYMGGHRRMHTVAQHGAKAGWAVGREITAAVFAYL